MSEIQPAFCEQPCAGVPYANPQSSGNLRCVVHNSCILKGKARCVFVDAFPNPETCSFCLEKRKSLEPGGPEHNYGPTRGHRPHCTCDGCF